MLTALKAVTAAWPCAAARTCAIRRGLRPGPAMLRVCLAAKAMLRVWRRRRGDVSYHMGCV